jgi:hypothetical protein
MVNIIMFALNQHSSTATVPILLQPKFFRWNEILMMLPFVSAWCYRIGWILPYNQLISGGRYILFGSHPEECHRAVGVLLTWIFLVSFFSWRLILRKKRIQRAGIRR